MKAHYDDIGKTYTSTRGTDPTIYGHISAHFGGARRILNVGAGTGSYEPQDREVLALEPSATMIAQRSTGAAPTVQDVVEALPFANDSFDLTMGILTLHHWQDWRQGLREAMRVSGGEVLLLTWFGFRENFWLSDYFPGAADYDNSRFPDKESYEEVLGEIEVHTVPIPHDCRDGFMCAYWRRPEAYLDPAVRAGISAFPMIKSVEAGVAALRADLDSGRWQDKYGALLAMDEFDFGYRLLRTGKT